MVGHIIYGWFFIGIVFSYLDISLQVERKGDLVAYKMPVLISSVPYYLKISSQNKEEYILKPT